MFIGTRSLGLIACGLLLFGPQLIAAADHAAMAPYLTHDVVAIGYVDLTRVDMPAAAEELLRAGIVPEADQADAARAATELQAEVNGLRQLAVRRAYVLFRVSDVAEGGTTWIVEVERGGKATEAAKFLNDRRRQFMPPAGTPAAVVRDFLLPKEFSAVSETIVAAGTETQRARVKELVVQTASQPREESMAALAGLGDADAGLAVIGDAESRRVVREMFPQLPAPFMEINGKLLADGVRWAGAGVTLPPKFQLTITVDAASPEIARTLEQAIGNAMFVAKALLTKDAIEGPPAHQDRAKGLLPLLALVSPTVEGTGLSVTFGDDEEEVAFIRDFLPAMTQKMRDELYRKSRMNNFKQIALGLHNHESAKSTFPAGAIYDNSGKPLLSWRVQLLPYMEQMKLYNQFHLDEPWDSEHNRKLIDQMPEFYADPDPAVRAAIGDRGRTTFLAPRAEGTVFGGREGIKFGDLKDGSSQTIMVVEVVPQRAVVWTKPDDWEVDLANPLDGVKRSDRDGFVAAWGDGHASIISNGADAEEFRGNLTYDGGEAPKP
ncbi:DUF1559 family PulG-like putative transporter [Lacipirellula limnantheis]|uniref:DUF1559 domain-containing protein n=1 Tax=Lacipirellula limnantheis TaxID=2528024 RepID=A0A517TRR9_9BACT|nr:DUF1559 domain-containing protein [Lacipirellula limnantheis]QDT71071.1 hypothetical protein I41_02260 [Lacipirellula limnantheis]